MSAINDLLKVIHDESFSQEIFDMGEQAAAEQAAMQERIKELMKRLHTDKGYVDEAGYSAWQSGYDAAMFDGIDISSELPCKCEICLKAYEDGEQTAIKELMKGNS